MTHPDNPLPGDLPRSFTVMPAQDQAMERIVKELLLLCPAQFALVVERSGFLLMSAGQSRVVDLSALASLVAGDMAASQEIARRTGQFQGCQLTLREGPEANTFLAEAGPDLILFAQISKDVPIGWARLLIQESGRQLSQVLTTSPDEVDKLDLGLKEDKLAAWFDEAMGALQAG